MAKITYHTHDSKTHTIDVQNGLTVMEGAVQNDIPGIDADCGGGMITVTTGDENADLYVTRRGSLDAVGKPTKEYNKESFAITVNDPNELDSHYLYYMLSYIHSTGYFKTKANGTTNLVNIRKEDILNIPVK